MSTAAEPSFHSEGHPLDAPRLRLLAKDEGRAPEPEPARPVLVAGADAGRRAGVLEQLAGTMPESTRFEQAEAIWEVLAQAPASRMVVLSGDLDDLPAEELLHMLGHRHPDLPVVSLESPLPAGA